MEKKRHLSPVSYFYEDENKNTYLCPWGLPGESYLLTKTQKRTIDATFASILIFSLVLALYFLLQLNTGIFLTIILLVNIAAFLQLAFFSLYLKKLKTVELSEVKGKPENLIEYIELFWLQIFFVLLGSLFDPGNFYLLLAGLFIVIFYSFLIKKIWKNDGYVYTSRE